MLRQLYDLPENVRAELIDNVLIYDQAAPSRVHQTIVTVQPEQLLQK